MGLFSRKTKITADDFCRDFYNQWIFSPDIKDVDPWKVMCETSYKMIADIDSAFEQADFSIYMYELRLIRMEVFAVVWGHKFNEKWSLQQNEFTKHYLEKRGDADIWKSMENYNQAIARATLGGYQPGSRSEQIHIVQMNQLRTNFFDKWVECGHDSVVIARVANRLCSDKAWKSGRGNVYLAFELLRQLNCEEIDDEANLGLINVIHGFYLGTLEAMKNVKII